MLGSNLHHETCDLVDTHIQEKVTYTAHAVIIGKKADPMRNLYDIRRRDMRSGMIKSVSSVYDTGYRAAIYSELGRTSQMLDKRPKRTVGSDMEGNDDSPPSAKTRFNQHQGHQAPSENVYSLQNKPLIVR